MPASSRYARGGRVLRAAFPCVSLSTCVWNGRQFVRATTRHKNSFTAVDRSHVRTLVVISPNITTATRSLSKPGSRSSIDNNT
eukprot:6212739-Pleurochrysis_carterae.AAC.7